MSLRESKSIDPIGQSFKTMPPVLIWLAASVVEIAHQVSRKRKTNTRNRQKSTQRFIWHRGAAQPCISFSDAFLSCNRDVCPRRCSRRRRVELMGVTLGARAQLLTSLRFISCLECAFSPCDKRCKVKREGLLGARASRQQRGAHRATPGGSERVNYDIAEML
ncbi:hypothetical protein JYU34_015814, partial [Plutella xylostella]